MQFDSSVPIGTADQVEKVPGTRANDHLGADCGHDDLATSSEQLGAKQIAAKVIMQRVPQSCGSLMTGCLSRILPVSSAVNASATSEDELKQRLTSGGMEFVTITSPMRSPTGRKGGRGLAIVALAHPTVLILLFLVLLVFGIQP